MPTEEKVVAKVKTKIHSDSTQPQHRGRLQQQQQLPTSPFLAERIEKIELLPDDYNVQVTMITNLENYEKPEDDGRDSIFSADDGFVDADGDKTPASTNQILVPQRKDISNKQVWQLDAENLRMRRRLREAALLKAMSAPGRSRRQLELMALTGADPSSMDTGTMASTLGYEGSPTSSYQGGASLRSAWTPPHPHVSSSNLRVTPKLSQSIFLAARTNNEDEIESHDNASGISLVTSIEPREVDMSLLTDLPNCEEQNNFSMVKSGQPCSTTTIIDASTSLNANELYYPLPPQVVVRKYTPTDYRSDLLYTTGTIDMDEGLSDEHRQSPEHSQTSSPTTVQHASYHPVSELKQLGIVNTQSTTLWEVAAPSFDNHTSSGMCHMPSLMCKSRSTAPSSAMETVDVVRQKSLGEDQNNIILKPRKSAANPSCLKQEGANDAIISKDGNDTNADEGDESQDCTHKKGEVTLPVITSTDLGRMLSSNEGSEDEILRAEEPLVFDTGVNEDAKKLIGAFHEVRKDSGHNPLYTQSNFVRVCAPSSPRSAILEERGWSHHHRYARHRSTNPSEPFTRHVSTALGSVNGGMASMLSHRHHCMVESHGARGLAELRALTNELMELRAWKVSAAKSLEDAHEKEMKTLRASRAEALEEATKLRSEVASLRSIAESEGLEWKTAAEQAVMECGKETAKLAMSNKELREENEKLLGDIDALNSHLESMLKLAEEQRTDLSKSNEVLKTENEKLCDDIDTLNNHLESMLHLAEEQRSLTEEEARGLHMMLQADITRLESNLNESKCLIDVKDEELVTLREQFSNLSTKLELEGSKLAAADALLKEDMIVHTICKEKLEAATRENLMLLEQLESQDSTLEEFKELMKTNELAVEQELEQSKTLRRQLEEEAAQAQNTIQELVANKKQKEEEAVGLMTSVMELTQMGKEYCLRLTELRDWKSNAEDYMANNSKMIEQLVSQLSCSAGDRNDGEAIKHNKTEILLSLAKKKTDEILTLKEDLAATKKEFARQNREISDVKLQLVANDEAKQRLEDALRYSNDEVTRLKKERKNTVKETSAEMAPLRDKLNAVSQELSEMKVLKIKADESMQTAFLTSKSLHQELQAARASHEEIVSHLESSKSELDQTKVNLRRTCQEAIDLRSELNEVSAKLALLEQYRQSSEEARIVNQELSLTLEKEKGQLADRDDVIECLTDVIGDLQEKLAANESTREQLEATLHCKSYEMTRLKTAITNLSEESSTMHAQLSGKIQSLSQELTEINKMKLMSEESLEAASAAIKSQREELHSKQASHDETVSQLKSIIHTNKAELYLSCQEASGLRSELNEVASNLARLEKLRSSNDLSRKLMDELDSKAQHVLMLQHEKDEAISNQEELERRMRESEVQLQLCKGKFDLLLEESSYFPDQHTLEQESKSKDLSKSLLIAKRLTSEVDYLTVLIETDRAQREKFSTEMARSEGELSNLQDKLLLEQALSEKRLEMYEAEVVLLEEIRARCAAFEGESSNLKDQLLRERESKHDNADLFERVLMTKEDCIQELETQIKTITEQISSLQQNCIEYDREINAANECIALKSAEVSILSNSVKRLEDELHETVQIFETKISEERGPRLDETRRLSANICAKEKDVALLQDKLKASLTQARNIQNALDLANLMIEPKDVEIAELRITNRIGLEKVEEKNEELSKMKDKITDLERLCHEKQDVINDKEAEICFLYGECEQLNQLLEEFETEMSFLSKTMESTEQKYESIYREKISHFEQESLAIVKERDVLKQDAESKLKVISELITSHNEILDQMNVLSLSREDLERSIETLQKEKMTSEILAQRIVELENDLEQLGEKYQSAKYALAEMEEALMVVEILHRKVQISPLQEEFTLEPWGFIEGLGCIEGDNSMDENGEEILDFEHSTHSLDSIKDESFVEEKCESTSDDRHDTV